METPLEILNRIRQAKAAAPPAPAAEALGQPVANLGAPPHLLPGQIVRDPQTGEALEVIAYGRAHTIAEAAPRGGA